jgi:hypothetical protein
MRDERGVSSNLTNRRRLMGIDFSWYKWVLANYRSEESTLLHCFYVFLHVDSEIESPTRVYLPYISIV